MNLPVGAVHHVPGRIRIRLPFLKGDPETLNEVKSFLDRIDGVHHVKFNVLTGSVLVRYDPRDYDVIFDRVADAIKNNFGLLIAAAPKLLDSDALSGMEQYSFDISGPSKASAALSDTFRGVDRWLRISSENAVDIRSIVPIGLGTAAVLAVGGASTPLWAALAIASFTSYVALNPRVVLGDGNGPESEPQNVREQLKEAMYPDA